MAFQILDKENNALTMGELDKIVANFWGVEVNPTRYARPASLPTTNGWDWYNWIGGSITALSQGKHEWRDVIGHLCSTAAIGEVSMEGFIDTIEAYKPYIELCFYFNSLGYTPISF